MAAPWGVELNQHVLLRVHRHLVEVFAHQNLHTSGVPVLGNLLGHQVLLQLSSKELCDESFDVLNLDLVVVLVSVDGDKQHLALVLLGNALEHRHIVSVRVGLDAEESKEVGLDVAREDLLSCLLVKVNNKGQRLASDEGIDSFLGDVLGQHGAAVVESLQQKHSLALNLVLSSDLGTGGDGEGNVIDVGGGGEVSLCCIRCLVGKHSNHCHVLASDKGSCFLDRSKSQSGGSGLLLQPRDNCVGSSAASIFCSFPIAEELEGRVASHLEFLSDGTLLGSIELGENNLRLLLSQHACSLGILRCQSFAVSTPRCIELDEDKFIAPH